MANKDGSQPGADGGAKQDAGKSGDAADDKTAVKKSNSGDAETDDELDPLDVPRQMTQRQIDAIVEKRLSRATKEAKEKAELSKEQLLEKERDEALKKANLADTRDNFIAAIGDDVSYAKASKFFRMYADDIETDDKGKITNLKDVMKTIRADWPGEFKKTPDGGADLGGGNGDRDKPAGVNMNQAIRKKFGR